MTAPVTDRPDRPALETLLDLPPNNPRAGRRRVLYLVGLLPLLVALAFTVKVVTMRHHDNAGASAFHAGNGATALEEYTANRSINILQRWLAPYDSGDAAFLLADYPRARDLFTSALASVPHKQECTVRINLSLADEAIGDAAAKAGRTDDANSAWQSGIDALDQGDCPTHAGLGTKQSQDAAAVRQRLEQKLHQPPPQQSPQNPNDKSQDNDQGNSKEQQKQQQLQQRNNSGSRDREKAKDLHDYDDFGDNYSW